MKWGMFIKLLVVIVSWYKSNYYAVCAHVPGHIRLSATLWTTACQASLSMEFPKQEYWKQLPFSHSGDYALYIFLFLFLAKLYLEHLKFKQCCMCVPEKTTAAHSSPLAWKIPWTEEPGGLQSMGSWRVGHDWAASLSLLTFMHWRRKWQPTPVFLPGESQGRGSLVGCRLWGHTGSDTTEAT